MIEEKKQNIYIYIILGVDKQGIEKGDWMEKKKKKKEKGWHS